MYGVVARRRGRIIAEEMKEGTEFFTVSAKLAVVESFGFADGVCSSDAPVPGPCLSDPDARALGH